MYEVNVNSYYDNPSTEDTAETAPFPIQNKTVGGRGQRLLQR